MKILFFTLAICGIVACNRDYLDLINFQNEISNYNIKNSDTSAYYWYNGEKVFVTPNETKYYVVSSDLSNSKYSVYQRGIEHIIGQNNFQKLKCKPTSVIYDVLKEDLKSINNVLYKAPYYILDNGEEIAITDIFSVKLLSHEDIDFLYNLAKETKTRVIGRNEYDSLWYYIQCDLNTVKNSMEMANFFYETKMFKFAAPEIIAEVTPAESPNDPLYAEQWALNNVLYGNIDIDYPNLQNYNFANLGDITIALIDSGIDMNHTDLNINVTKSYDAYTSTEGQVLRGPHGTKCSGVIIAKTNNNQGIVGIAPGVSLMPISVLFKKYAAPNENASSTLHFAKAIQYAHYNNADVISNSWTSSAKNDDRDEAIRNAVKYGRNGLGCVIVFASGNDSLSTCTHPSLEIPEIITVGALRKDGIRPIFSNYGNELDIVAPGSYIKTTVIGGGYEDAHGTSLACPHVSGVAALILAVNPYLTQREVCDIIEKTATKLPAYLYTTKINRPNGTWNNETGYGLLNANAAVQMALSDDYSKNVVELENFIITTPRFFNGDVIKCKQVSAYPGGALILSADDMIEINSPFTFMAGSSFEFHIQQ